MLDQDLKAGPCGSVTLHLAAGAGDLPLTPRPPQGIGGTCDKSETWPGLGWGAGSPDGTLGVVGVSFFAQVGHLVSVLVLFSAFFFFFNLK